MVIHYAELGVVGDINSIFFDSLLDAQDFLDSIIYPLSIKNERIYLVAIDDEITISENAFYAIDEFIFSFYPESEMEDIYIQEYSSYEEAYKVALNMREESPLCYEPESK